MASIVPNFAYFISFIVATPSKRYCSQVGNLCNFTLLINGRTRIKNQICWILPKYAFNYFITLLFKGYKNKYDVISISCSRLKLNGTENDKNFISLVQGLIQILNQKTNLLPLSGVISKEVHFVLLPLGTCVFFIAVICRGNFIQLLWKRMMIKSIFCYSFPVKNKKES